MKRRNDYIVGKWYKQTYDDESVRYAKFRKLSNGFNGKRDEYFHFSECIDIDGEYKKIEGDWENHLDQDATPEEIIPSATSLRYIYSDQWNGTHCSDELSHYPILTFEQWMEEVYHKTDSKIVNSYSLY